MINIKRAATIAVAAMTVAAAGCGGGDSSGPTGPGGDNQLGLYALMTANKKVIPTEIYHGPFFDETIPRFFNQVIVRVTGGELVLQEDNRFHLAIDLYLYADGDEDAATLAVDGDFETEGGKIELWADGAEGPVVAAIRNGTVTFTSDTGTAGNRAELTFKHVP